MKLKLVPVSYWKMMRFKYKSLNDCLKTSDQTVPVVASLTSIPSRLNTINLTIKSLLCQRLRPQKIVLWLNESLRDQVPSNLIKLTGDVFEIRFSDLDCPHLKLVESLKAFPEMAIVTFDDDEMYDKETLSLLYKEHLEFPKGIIANRCRLITYDSLMNLEPYNRWKFTPKKDFDNALLLPLGSFGVLYPPGSLEVRVIDQDLFLKLSPKADDLWFKMAAILQKTISRQNRNVPQKPIPILRSQKIALKTVNKGQDLNRVQWNNLMSYFNLTPEKIKELFS